MRWESSCDGEKELETVMEEDEGCTSEKSIEARLSITNPKRSLEKRSREDEPRVACCIHSVTLKQTHVVALTSSQTDEVLATDGGGGSKVCVMEDDSATSTPHGSFRSCREGGDQAVEPATNNGTYGEISVQNSSDIHFGNKIYTAPITVVNQVGGDETEFAVDSGSYKGQSKKNSSSSCRSTLSGAGSRICGRNVLTAFYFLVIVGLSVGLIIALISSSQNEDNTAATTTPPSVTNDQDIYFNETWFYTRQDWKAAAPTAVVKFQKLADMVIISHTHVLSLVCTGHVFCGFYIRMMQKIQMEYDLKDISYNYIISAGSDGALYVGRGAKVEGEHTPGSDARSIGIAFIGDYNKRKPNDNQLAHAKMLIDEAVRLGKLSDRYKLVGQGQIMDTDSPGAHLMEAIKKWSHWVEVEKPSRYARPTTTNNTAEQEMVVPGIS